MGVEFDKLFICRLFASLKGRNSILLISVTENMLKFEIDGGGRSRAIVIALDLRKVHWQRVLVNEVLDTTFVTTRDAGRLTLLFLIIDMLIGE